MSTAAGGLEGAAPYPVRVHVEHPGDQRNRLTTAFRLVLAIPHLILVGGPFAAGLFWSTASKDHSGYQLGTAAGLLGAVVGMIAIIAWFAILFTGKYPRGLWDLAAYYLRWRVRAMAYFTLLRDEYPPFGDGAYAAALEIERPDAPRDRLTVGFRMLLALPQLFVVWLVTVAWFFATVIAWFAILLTGRYPDDLWEFGVGALRWNTRVEAYVLLLRDEYPPFGLG